MAKEVHILDNCCCGLPAWSYGDMAAARKLAEKNLDIFAARDLDVIVADCSSCASFLKKYAIVFPPGHELHDRAVSVVTKVCDMVALLFENQTQSTIHREPLTVTYHDPCHASRGQGIVKEPREMLKQLPGIDFKELPEADWCCGGAGSYAVAHHALSRQVLDRKMENLKITGADLLVTSCPACVIQLSFGVRRHGLNTRVCHISEIV
jgi:glycolate oxidase iron-sulfur subunit